jgi:hypothetical protein
MQLNAYLMLNVRRNDVLDSDSIQKRIIEKEIIVPYCSWLNKFHDLCIRSVARVQ